MSQAAKPHTLAYYLKLSRQLLGVPADRRAIVAHLREDPEMRNRFRAAASDLMALLGEAEERRSR
jgi:hypothetical protein